MKRTFLFFLVITAVFLLGHSVVYSANKKTITQSSLTFEDDAMLFHWQVPEPHFFVEDQVAYVEIPDYALNKTPGDYLLPMDDKLIAIPNGAEPTFEIVSVEELSRPLQFSAAIAPMPAGVIRDEAGQVIGGDYQPVLNATPQAPALVRLDEVGVMRGVRLMRLTLHPVRPQQDTYLVAKNVTVRVRFNVPERQSFLGESFNLANTAVSDTLLKTVQSMVVNPQQVSSFQSNQMVSVAKNLHAATTNEPTVAIEVVESGITAVTYADLTATGFPIQTANPQNLHLKHDGVAVPIEWIGDGDAAFENDEYFLFYAAPRSSRWFNGDIYLLTADSSAGQRISEQSANPNGLSAGQAIVETTIEKNDLYTPDCLCGALPLGRDGDRFVWNFMTPDERFKQYSYSIPLANVDVSEDAQLTLWFIGYTAVSENPDHQVDVSWNGADIGSVSWDGKTAVTGTLTIPSANLLANNEMTITLVNPPGVTVNGVWFDAAQVHYVRNNAQAGNALQFTAAESLRKYEFDLASTTDLFVFDVTDTENPKKLVDYQKTGSSVAFASAASAAHQYAIANQNGILSPDNFRLLKNLQTENTIGADYIIISPDEFMPALSNLISLRQSQGLQVVVEDVQAIYDQYAGGFPEPEAIHAYLANTYLNWNPLPEYVLLVGDASFDPKQYRDTTTKTWIAPYLLEVDPWIGEVPTDNRFVTFDGGNSDNLPDMIIGRFPVNSLSETQTVVDKIVDYETIPVFGSWNGRIPFIADDEDNAGDFAYHSNNLINQYLTAPLITPKIYLNVTVNNADDMNADLLNLWDQGNGIIFYNGHSSRFQWAAERVFHQDDVVSLTNGGRLPIVVEMTCLTGSFHLPGTSTLDESLLRQEGGGAVAVWGATGLGVATGHQELSSAFLQSLITDGNPNIGQAILAGKLNLKYFNRDLADTFTLLGDPYLHLDTALPEYQVYLPSIANK